LGLCLALNRTRDTRLALDELEDLIRRSPDCSEAYLLQATLRESSGDAAGAVRSAREGLRVTPRSGGLHTALARGLLGQGETPEALRHYQLALRYEPDAWRALVGLAWVRAAHEDRHFRDGAEAVALATRACELTHRQWPQALHVLAAALAETGQYQRAAQEIESALSSASSLDDVARPDQLRRDLEQYRVGTPLRESPRNLAGR
ncbi:MAG TPA: tetratricopeptide repeat protein, partial [Gemmataceae bacterium]|nr:tetratricopeptide repeat protein [Gemmataceae bacterium]